MSWQCTEYEDSRHFDDTNGVLRGERTFTVWSDDETLNTALLVQDKFGQTSANGTLLPGYFSYFLDDGRLVSVSPNIRLIDAASQTWRVVWTYAQFNFGGSAATPTDIGWVEFTASGRVEFRDKWRINASIPVVGGIAGQVSLGMWSNIGGESNDIAGTPLSALHRTQEIVVNVTLGGPPQWEIMRAARGRRNLTYFGGIPPGYLLFDSYTVARVTPTRYRVGYRFVEDQDAHLIQSPFRDGKGEIVLGDVATSVGGIKAKVAAAVLWRQPFPNPIDFYSIDPFFAGQI